MTQMAARSLLDGSTKHELVEARDQALRRRRVAEIYFRVMWLTVPTAVLAFYVAYKVASPTAALAALTLGMGVVVASGMWAVTQDRRSRH